MGHKERSHSAGSDNTVPAQVRGESSQVRNQQDNPSLPQGKTGTLVSSGLLQRRRNPAVVISAHNPEVPRAAPTPINPIY